MYALLLRASEQRPANKTVHLGGLFAFKRSVKQWRQIIIFRIEWLCERLIGVGEGNFHEQVSKAL